MEIVKNGMFNHIYEVDCFHKEFIQLADEKFTLFTPYPRYPKWLIRSLTILEQQRRHVLRLDGFEQLKNVIPNLYSIRYPHSPLNLRVLYSYLTQNDILLLINQEVICYECE